MFLRRINRDERDREVPRTWRAVIYLCEPAQDTGGPLNGPSLAKQRADCRFKATVMRAEVVGEFVDEQPYVPLRPALHQALEFAQSQRLDYLIVSSLDLLADSPESVLETGWRLGHAGTIPVFDGE